MTKFFLICSLLVVVALGLGCAEQKHTTNHDFELSFWFSEGAKENDSRIISIDKHCCCSGRIATARVSRMPSFDRSEALVPELVIEFSGQGTIVRRWGIPANSTVAAISESQIIVPEGQGTGLSISDSGDLMKIALSQEAGSEERVDCPRFKEFEDSAYLRCLSCVI